MPEFVFLNDRVVPAVEARVSVFDRGFLYGDGLFETIRASGQQVFFLEEHLDRLKCSAALMALELPWTKARLSEAVNATLRANELTHASVRLTVTRGEGPPIPDPSTAGPPTLVITCRPVPPLGGQVFDQGVDIVVLTTKRNLNEAFPVAVKSCNFLNNIFARQELRQRGAYEGLMLNHQGYLTEGTVSNFFFVKEGCLLTPALECGLLEGITRAIVIEKAGEMGVPVKEGSFYEEELYGAQEAFLTNSISLVVPVRKIGDRVLDQVPGKITAAIFDKIVTNISK